MLGRCAGLARLRWRRSLGASQEWRLRGSRRTEYRAAARVDGTAVLTAPSRGKALLALAFCCLLSGSTCAHSTPLGLSIQKTGLHARPDRRCSCNRADGDPAGKLTAYFVLHLDECRVVPQDVSNAMLPRYLLGLLINILAGICLLQAYLTHEHVVNTDGAENTVPPPGSFMYHCARRGNVQTAVQRHH